MKTLISYFLLALTALSVAAGQRPVYDMDGNTMSSSGRYYVRPFTRGQGGGLTFGRRGNTPCPVDIVQEPYETEEGLPIRFSNWRSEVEFVPQNTILNIETNEPETSCWMPTYWWMYEFVGHDMDHWLLTTGPEPDQHREEWLKSLFEIRETEERYVYKITFCPHGPGTWPFCGNLEIFVDHNGVRRLRLGSNNPFLVQFKKDNRIGSVLSKNM